MEPQHINDTLRNFISNGNDVSSQEIIAKLKFISQIEENKIIDTQYFSVLDKSYPTSIYRTIISRNQSRKVALKFFQDTINSAFSAALSYADADDKFIKKTGEMILGELDGCIHGLENYAKTYASDIMFVSKLNTLIETTQAKLDALTESIKASEPIKAPEPVKVPEPTKTPVKPNPSGKANKTITDAS